MEQGPLPKALLSLTGKLAAFNPQIGHYHGYESSGKGITLQLERGSLFLYHSFIHKLVNEPEQVTESDLANLALNLR